MWTPSCLGINYVAHNTSKLIYKQHALLMWPQVILKKVFSATPLPSYIHAKMQFKMTTEWLAWDELAQEAKKTNFQLKVIILWVHSSNQFPCYFHMASTATKMYEFTLCEIYLFSWHKELDANFLLSQSTPSQLQTLLNKTLLHLMYTFIRLNKATYNLP